MNFFRNDNYIKPTITSKELAGNYLWNIQYF